MNKKIIALLTAFALLFAITFAVVAISDNDYVNGNDYAEVNDEYYIEDRDADELYGDSTEDEAIFVPIEVDVIDLTNIAPLSAEQRATDISVDVVNVGGRYYVPANTNNMIQNGNFQAGMAPWTTSGADGTSASPVTGSFGVPGHGQYRHFRGTHVARIQPASVGGTAALTQNITGIIPNRVYIASAYAWVWNSAAAAGQGSMEVRVFDGATLLSTYTYNFRRSNAATGRLPWDYGVIAFRAPAGATRAEIEFRNHVPTGAPNTSFMIDQVQMFEAQPLRTSTFVVAETELVTNGSFEGIAAGGTIAELSGWSGSANAVARVGGTPSAPHGNTVMEIRSGAAATSTNWESVVHGDSISLEGGNYYRIGMQAFIQSADPVADQVRSTGSVSLRATLTAGGNNRYIDILLDDWSAESFNRWQDLHTVIYVPQDATLSVSVAWKDRNTLPVLFDNVSVRRVTFVGDAVEILNGSGLDAMANGFNMGDELTLRADFQGNGTARNAVLLFGLFNAEGNALIAYSTQQGAISATGNTVLTAALNLSAVDLGAATEISWPDVQVRAFIWDSLDSMNVVFDELTATP